MSDPKKEVHDFWNEASCGERLLLEASDKAGYLAQLEKRHSLEPFIESFARYQECGDLHLESPGTKAYTKSEARELFRRFADIRISVVLTHGDLLESDAGQRHRGWLLSLAKRLWPRRLLRWALPGQGLFMLIEAQK